MLPASEARLHGSDLKYETGHQRDNLGFWTNPEDWADWEFKVTKPGKFDVTRRSRRLGKGLPGSLRRRQPTTGTAAVTGDYGKFKVAKLGTVEIPSPGKATLAVRPVKDGWHPLNLKAIRLKPSPAQ